MQRCPGLNRPVGSRKPLLIANHPMRILFSRTSHAVAAAAIAAAFTSGCAAAEYYVVTPMPGAKSPVTQEPNIEINLAGALLPTAWAGVAYSHDFKPYVTVLGDPELDPDAISLSSPMIPQGLLMDSFGMLDGVPTTVGPTQLTVQAHYRDQVVERSYGLQVSKQVKQAGASRTWSDGTLARSCLDYRTDRDGQAYQGAIGDGVYRIDIPSLGAVDVLCDMTTDGGGWTVFQARRDGSVDFLRDWNAYAQGFGTAQGEHWLGNDRISVMTSAGAELRIDMTRFTGEQAYVRYSTFTVEGPETGYRLTAVGHSGSVGDSLLPHSGMAFSTIDRDNDARPDESCVERYKGAWWHRTCHQSNLNGLYHGPGVAPYGTGVIWQSFTGYTESLKSSTMKFRERSR